MRIKYSCFNQLIVIFELENRRSNIILVKSYIFKPIGALFFFFTTSLSLSGQFWKDDTTSTKKEGFFVIPLLYYTPDTRFAAGAMGVYYFHTGSNDSMAFNPTRLSYVKLLADYTQNKQLDIWSSWNIFTNEERFLFKGELR